MTKSPPPSPLDFDDYRSYLAALFAFRRRRNPGYSLRSFARNLGLSASRLSEVLNSNQEISVGTAASVVQWIDLDPDETEHFLDLVRDRRAEAVERAEIEQRAALRRSKRQLRILREEQLALISDWTPWALMELLSVYGGRLSEAALAQRLGLTPERIVTLVERLVALAYIERDGEYFRTLTPRSRSTEDIPSAVIQSYHDKMLDVAKSALKKQSVEQREFSNTVLTVDRRCLIEAKQFLRDFREQFVRTFAKPAQDDAEVYNLSFALFSLEK